MQYFIFLKIILICNVCYGCYKPDEEYSYKIRSDGITENSNLFKKKSEDIEYVPHRLRQVKSGEILTDMGIIKEDDIKMAKSKGYGLGIHKASYYKLKGRPLELFTDRRVSKSNYKRKKKRKNSNDHRRGNYGIEISNSESAQRNVLTNKDRNIKPPNYIPLKIKTIYTNVGPVASSESDLAEVIYIPRKQQSDYNSPTQNGLEASRIIPEAQELPRPDRVSANDVFNKHNQIPSIPDVGSVDEDLQELPSPDRIRTNDFFNQNNQIPNSPDSNNEDFLQPEHVRRANENAIQNANQNRNQYTNQNRNQYINENINQYTNQNINQKSNQKNVNRAMEKSTSNVRTPGNMILPGSVLKDILLESDRIYKTYQKSRALISDYIDDDLMKPLNKLSRTPESSPPSSLSPEQDADLDIDPIELDVSVSSRENAVDCDKVAEQAGETNTNNGANTTTTTGCPPHKSFMDYFRIKNHTKTTGQPKPSTVKTKTAKTKATTITTTPTTTSTTTFATVAAKLARGETTHIGFINNGVEIEDYKGDLPIQVTTNFGNKEQNSKTHTKYDSIYNKGISHHLKNNKNNELEYSTEICNDATTEDLSSTVMRGISEKLPVYEVLLKNANINYDDTDADFQNNNEKAINQNGYDTIFKNNKVGTPKKEAEHIQEIYIGDDNKETVKTEPNFQKKNVIAERSFDDSFGGSPARQLYFDNQRRILKIPQYPKNDNYISRETDNRPPQAMRRYYKKQHTLTPEINMYIDNIDRNVMESTMAELKKTSKPPNNRHHGAKIKPIYREEIRPRPHNTEIPDIKQNNEEENTKQNNKEENIKQNNEEENTKQNNKEENIKQNNEEENTIQNNKEENIKQNNEEENPLAMGAGAIQTQDLSELYGIKYRPHDVIKEQATSTPGLEQESEPTQPTESDLPTTIGNSEYESEMRDTSPKLCTKKIKFKMKITQPADKECHSSTDSEELTFPEESMRKSTPIHRTTLEYDSLLTNDAPSNCNGQPDNEQISKECDNLNSNEAAESFIVGQELMKQQAEAAAYKARILYMKKSQEVSESTNMSVIDKEIIIGLMLEMIKILDRIHRVNSCDENKSINETKTVADMSTNILQTMTNSLINAKKVEGYLQRVSMTISDLKEENEMSLDALRQHTTFLKIKLSEERKNLARAYKAVEIAHACKKKKRRRFRLFPWKRSKST